MDNLSGLLSRLPEESKDLRINAKRLLEDAGMGQERAWAVALTSAYFLKNAELISAIEKDASSVISKEAIEDAKASASIMGMNGIYYRFRHLVEKESYNKKPANLRMMRMAKPATTKIDFELNSMACAVLAGCQMCIQSHEKILLDGGVSEDEVHDVARIAAVLHGVTVALACTSPAA